MLRLVAITSSFLLLAAASAGPAVAVAKNVKVGKQAPELELRNTENRPYRLSEIAYPGTPKARFPKSSVLLDFFSTSCTPCRKALPDVIKLHHATKDKGLKIILVAVLEMTDPDARNDLDEFLRQNPVPFPVLIDAYQDAAKVYVNKGDKADVPSYILIDSNGIIRDISSKLNPMAVLDLLDEQQVN